MIPDTSVYSPELPVTLHAHHLFGSEKQILLDATLPTADDEESPELPVITFINEDSEILMKIFLDWEEGEIRMTNPNQVMTMNNKIRSRPEI